MTHVNVIFFILHFEYLERPLYVDNFFSDESSIPSKKDGAFVRSRIEQISMAGIYVSKQAGLDHNNIYNIVRISKLFKKNVFH